MLPFTLFLESCNSSVCCINNVKSITIGHLITSFERVFRRFYRRKGVFLGWN
ncbi:hypothetical protein HMPREF0201_00093 [Cedecea davisae DSM 4568]|uniref:Uncharacterized protein n=1 Tax=Cedecea davisae DSM 4568 TaxID=566551 RepID=S3JJN2_9ENTR|nr:hypothetical protein HMPREF0201_00093 [Cedecea davisae DSM 4568]